MSNNNDSTIGQPAVENFEMDFVIIEAAGLDHNHPIGVSSRGTTLTSLQNAHNTILASGVTLTTTYNSVTENDVRRIMAEEVAKMKEELRKEIIAEMTRSEPKGNKRRIDMEL